MTISKELFLAILSMDSYNRGYGAGLSDGKHVENGVDLGLGDASGSAIGSATVSSRISSDPQGAAKTAGFYALAYSIDATGPEDLANKTALAYRGTDNPSTSYDADYGGSAITPVQGLC